MNTRPPLSLFLRGGAFVSIYLCALAGVAALIVSLVNLVRFRSFGSMSLRELVITIVVIAGSYFAAGLVSASVLWVLSPLRHSLLGHVVRGAILGVIIYGTVGLTSVLVYTTTGVNLIGYDSAGEAWHSLITFIPISVGVGVAGGIAIFVQTRLRAV